MGMFDDAGLGIPAISFVGARKGLKITGIILPQGDPGKSKNEAYRKSDATDQKTGEVKKFKSGDPMPRFDFLLQTDERDWKLSSAKFETRAQDEFPDEVDTGLRRWIAEPKYAIEALKEAFKTKKSVDPEVGGRFTISVVGLKQGTIQQGDNAGDPYTTPQLTVGWEPPTSEGRALAEKYREEHLQRDDSGSGQMFAQEDDAPPF